MGLRKKKNTQQIRRRMNRAQKRKFIALMGLIFFCALFVIGIFYSSVYRYVHKTAENQIEKNVFVQGTDVSGMTRKQALDTVEERWTVMKNTPVILKENKKTAYVTLSELEVRQGKVEKLVKEALEYGKKGTLFQRYRKIRYARKNKVEYKEKYRFDEDQALKMLTEKTEDFFEKAADAKITRVGGVFQITDEQEGETADVEKILEEIKDRIGDFEKGKEVEIEVDSRKDEPEICKEDLERIQNELGSTAMEIEDENCRQELLTFTGKLNGVLIMPDKQCSLHKVFGEHIKNEEFQESMNRMATVLYDTALYSEIGIEERHASDSMPKDVEAGMEAVLNEKKDLRIKNTTKAPVYIETYINSEGELICTLYGEDTREKGRSIFFKSEVTEKNEYRTVYEESEVLAAGRMKIKEKGSPESTVVLRKEIKEAGKQTKKEKIGISEYHAADQIISVGIKTDDQKIKEQLKEAIATQEKKTIEKAVKKARNQ